MHFHARLWVSNWMIFPILDTPTLPAYTVAQIRERDRDSERKTETETAKERQRK